MDFLQNWIFLCKLWNTNLPLLLNCDSIFQTTWILLWLFWFIFQLLWLVYLINLEPIWLLLKPTMVLIVICWLIFSIIILISHFYLSINYIKNKKLNTLYLKIFIFFAILFSFLNIKYLIYFLILDLILYFLWFLLKKYNNFKKLSNKELNYIFIYGKFIPILGYLYSFRIWLTNKIPIKKLIFGIIIWNINILFCFLILSNLFTHIYTIFNWYESTSLAYSKPLWVKILPFISIYLIWFLLISYFYYNKFKKINIL